ncbi:hypothetical protein KCP76_08765 [Salmonella enterica subsp. enterica serovar Weltevreden]|nr:hypothetical protein KCP76_08765 [Salmonella enterica subsp. enterica serovar Weltevreden]
MPPYSDKAARPFIWNARRQTAGFPVSALNPVGMSAYWQHGFIRAGDNLLSALSPPPAGSVRFLIRWRPTTNSTAMNRCTRAAMPHGPANGG